jgi:cyclopropane-fatty-acyl-phospholipid synthase
MSSTVTPDRQTAVGIDAQRWPDVASVPHCPFRAVAARRIFTHAVKGLPLRVVESGGHSYGGGRGTDPVLWLDRPAPFFHRLGAGGTIGFGEAYMAGDWTAEDVAGVIGTFAAHVRELVPGVFQRLRGAVLHRQPRGDDNTIAGARRNIHRHYDLSNDMFTVFLDDTMTYSSALYGGNPAESDDDLATAQRRKIDRLLDVIAVGRGSRLLEIGTGWGELAIRAAVRGAHVTSLTISSAQAGLARARIAAAGVGDRVDVRLEDYRRVEGRYDAVVSVEMIEAVGANHWGDYFRAVDRVLVPGGVFGLQTIVQDDEQLRRTGDTYTWIRKYIFPGGQLLSLEAVERTLHRYTSLRITDRLAFGQHYAETLRRWRARFEAGAAQIANLGFDETFRRMWSLYLAYSEAGFRTGYLDVNQLTVVKPARGLLRG